MSTKALPYWRLSGFYFFYFASLGALMPYLGLYLKSIGLVAAQIGVVFAVIQGTKLVSPSILAHLSSGFVERMRAIQIVSFISTIAFCFLFFQQGFLGIVMVMFAFSFFWNAMLPQFESITLTKLRNETSAYSGIRLWGSVGFIVTVAGVGFILEKAGLANWPVLVCVCLGTIFMSSLLLSEKRSVKSSTNHPSVTLILKQKKVIALFVVVFLIQASHGAYYAFFSILLDKLNYDETQIGQLWSLGVLAEIILFIVIKRVFKLVSLYFVLMLSIFLTVVRWLMIAWFSDSLMVLLIAQLLHAASFGAFHVVCIQLTHNYFKGSAHDKGQALYSSIGYGAGGMFGGLMAGLLWDDLGANWVFTMASLFSVIALAVAWKWVERNSNDGLDKSGDGVSPI
ncbi:MAG: MFS transporter [Piscirickettsiaceae bacterium]|nr:MAG: MFS transporter [Piscirickettsiaceae bacterium]